MRLLTISACARTLGVSRWTVRRWVAFGEVRAVRIAGRVRIPEGEVRRLLRVGGRRANADHSES
ncbi:MAG: hypothetical protein KatS3mg023_0746 [Armatimonadota bacterium]|nr:MAG: hypothetical protein KatS3mg023_0746 [Armatimonadota bacterium]